MDVNSELRDAQIEIRDTDQAHNANRKGLIFFNRVADKLKMLFNSEVKIIATEDWVISQVTNSENSLEQGGLLTQEQASTPSTPSTDLRRIYAKEDGIYEMGDDGTEYKLVRQSDFDDLQSNLPFLTKPEILTLTPGNTSGTTVKVLDNDAIVMVSFRGDADGTNIEVYAREWADSDQGDERDMQLGLLDGQGVYSATTNAKMQIFKAGTNIRYRANDWSTGATILKIYIFNLA